MFFFNAVITIVQALSKSNISLGCALMFHICDNKYQMQGERQWRKLHCGNEITLKIKHWITKI